MVLLDLKKTRDYLYEQTMILITIVEVEADRKIESNQPTQVGTPCRNDVKTTQNQRLRH